MGGKDKTEIRIKRRLGFQLKILCVTEAVCLFLTGCGRTDFKPEAEKEYRREQNEIISEDDEAVAKKTEEEEADGEESNAEEILAELVKDAGVRRCVWYDAGIREEDSKEIIQQKLRACKSLTLREAPCSSASICSLEDLALLPNLESLTIDAYSRNEGGIVDFTPVAKLSRLEQLYIERAAKEEIDFSFLTEMKTVKELFLPNCRLKDILFLEEMPQLERLSLYETPVDDLAVLEKLPELVELSLAGNADARNMDVVGKLSKMQDLGLQECGITDIRFLSDLKELQSLNLNGNSVEDLTPLAGLAKLERLGAYQNRIIDISPLANLSELYDLALDGNEIRDISALKNLSHLNQAGLSGNRISDLSPLAGKEELMYVTVSGNPCEDLRPVWDVPLLSFRSGVEEKEIEWVNYWMEEQYPDITEYECIDYAEGDLNKDGKKDIVFVLDGAFYGISKEYSEKFEGERELFVLLQQADGSMKEFMVKYMPGKDNGGMRGDPYCGIFLGEGYLMMKNAWGSSEGSADIEIYLYQKGKLERAKEITAGDCNFSYGYDVEVRNEKNSVWCRYVIAMDGYRMVRVDIADSEHPSHKAFPELDLYDMSYRIHGEKPKTNYTSAQALDILKDSMVVEAEKEELLYETWQKEGYELLKGAELPDYYYTVPGTEWTEEEVGKQWDGDYIYYNGLISKDEQLYHEIYYVTSRADTGRDEKVYLLNDVTGEIESD